MKGYKATDENMCCLGFRYEVGKVYEEKGKLSFYENGFHFCEKLIAIDTYYDLSTSRVFEIEATGTIEKDGLKFCTDEIKFIRELSKEEVIELANKSVNDKNAYIRMILAKSKLALPETLGILSKDKDSDVRECVAGNVNVSKKILKRLGQDILDDVQASVASNKNTNKEMLDALNKDEEFFIRDFIANNQNTNRKTLKCLSRDYIYTVKYLVAANLNTADIVLKEMCQDEHLLIRNTAKNTLEMK